MYSFFGLFTDPVPGLPQRICRAWPELSPIKIDNPISAIGVRFGTHRYEPSLEDTPAAVVHTVEELSQQSPARFMLLRTECWGWMARTGDKSFEMARQFSRPTATALSDA